MPINKYLAQGNKTQGGADATMHESALSGSRGQHQQQETDNYMTKLLALTAALVIALPSIASATCGTRGGPGLRGPDGNCVSWERLNSVCGSDGSRCQREQVNALTKQLDTTPPRKLMQCAHGMRNDC